jgi:hypothetical protein
MDLTKIENFGNQSLPSIIKDPFNKNKIYNIEVSFSDWSMNGGWKAEGTVRFANGNTKGQQNFKGQSFDDVVAQIKTMIENLT